MSDGTSVPIAWLFIVIFILGASVITMFVWWVRNEFDRNDRAHLDLRNLITKHDNRTTHNNSLLHRRIDWLIRHTNNCPPFKEVDEEMLLGPLDGGLNENS